MYFSNPKSVNRSITISIVYLIPFQIQTLLMIYKFHTLKTSCSFFYRYIKLYGLKFSKEDHISLIHLLMTVISMPDLDPWMVNRTATTLVVLLRKKDLLEPSDLTIQWKMLYNLYERLFFSPHQALGMVQYPK